MSITIQIQNRTIVFPESGASPNWAPAMVEFAQAVEDALATVTGGFDVAPQLQSIDSSNPGVDVDITALTFSPLDVVKATIEYAVFRSTTTSQVAEGGILEIVYNSTNPATNKWEITRDFAGDGQISFSITDAGQIQYTTTTISGSSHTGFISFRASSVLTS